MRKYIGGQPASFRVERVFDTIPSQEVSDSLPRHSQLQNVRIVDAAIDDKTLKHRFGHFSHQRQLIRCWSMSRRAKANHAGGHQFDRKRVAIRNWKPIKGQVFGKFQTLRRLPCMIDCGGKRRCLHNIAECKPLCVALVFAGNTKKHIEVIFGHVAE